MAIYKVAQESQNFHSHQYNNYIIYEDAIAAFLNSLESDLNNVVNIAIKQFFVPTTQS
jgi:hypothetical protein